MPAYKQKSDRAKDLLQRRHLHGAESYFDLPLTFLPERLRLIEQRGAVSREGDNGLPMVVLATAGLDQTHAFQNTYVAPDGRAVS